MMHKTTTWELQTIYFQGQKTGPIIFREKNSTTKRNMTELQLYIKVIISETMHSACVYALMKCLIAAEVPSYIIRQSIKT